MPLRIPAPRSRRWRQPITRKAAERDHHHSGAARTRCAIYTRKSSEENLEQEFNSLDAQHEACQAFVSSQKSAGWVALSDMYGDGGITGSVHSYVMMQPSLTLAQGPLRMLKRPET
jgi:hypothetical protein